MCCSRRLIVTTTHYNNETTEVHVDKFYRVLNVNNYALIVMCVVLQGLVRDCMAKGNYRIIAIL